MARKHPFVIYEIVSPSGKRYIGLTGQRMAKRFQQHVKRAESGVKHPLYASMRKHGAAAFVCNQLDKAATAEEAQAIEVFWIDAYDTTNRAAGYNVSRGGEYDVQAGVDALKAKMADPVWKAAYLEKLRQVCADRVFSPKAHAAGAAWRAANPRRMWQIGYRASRCAAVGRSKADPRFGPWGRLMIPGKRVLSARQSYFHKRNVTAVWARRDEDDRRVIGAKIGASVAASHAANPERSRASAAAARRHIDRKKQGPAASRGLKAWWAALKADPARYAAHMAGKKPRARKNI